LLIFESQIIFLGNQASFIHSLNSILDRQAIKVWKSWFVHILIIQ